MIDAHDCLESLARVPAVLSAMVGGISAERLGERRGADCWTLLEHLSHLAQVQPMLRGRIQRILTEDDPEFVPFIPTDELSKPKPEELPPHQLLERFAAERGSQLNILRACSPADWGRPARHPEYLSYDLAILVRHILMHDYWHMYRMEELWLTKPEHFTR